MKLFLNELSHVGFDLLCVLLAPNHSNQKVIRIADIHQPFVTLIHRVNIRDCTQILVDFVDFSIDRRFLLWGNFVLIPFQPLLLSAPLVQRFFIRRIDVPPITLTECLGISSHKSV